jgi:cytoskeletal protein CcmA (bactofilin family)
MCEVNILEIRVMLIGVSGTMVKEIKKRKFCIKNNIFYYF